MGRCGNDLQGWPFAKVSSCSRNALSVLLLAPANLKIKFGEPTFSNKNPLIHSHVSFCRSDPFAARPNLHRKRENDHVRGTTDGRHKPDYWYKVIDKSTPVEFQHPIETAVWDAFFADVQQLRVFKAAAGEYSSDSDSGSDSLL